MITTAKTSRNEIIDAAKGITIFLVVLGHLQSDICSKAIVLIASCHMPVFFFLSGLFFEHSYQKYDSRNFLIKKGKGLLWPYICWSLISFLVNAMLLILQKNSVVIGKEAFEIFLNARSVWFLMVLFLNNIVVWVIRKLTKGSMVAFYVVNLLAWSLMLLLGPSELFSFFKFEWLYPYFLLGTVLSSRFSFISQLDKIKEKKTSYQVGVFFIMLISFIGLVLGIFNQEVFKEFYYSFNLSVNYAGYYILYYLIGILGIAVVLGFSLLMSKIPGIMKVLTEWGGISLDIYVIHMFLVKAAKIILERKSVPDEFASQPALIIYALLIVVLISIVVKFILRKFKIYRFSLGEK